MRRGVSVNNEPFARPQEGLDARIPGADADYSGPGDRSIAGLPYPDTDSGPNADSAPDDPAPRVHFDPHFGARPALPSPTTHARASADQGPCLYFGPEGQRCDRPAVEGGFCQRHLPGGFAASVPPTARIIAAVGLIGVLLPYLVDLVRGILAMLRPH